MLAEYRVGHWAESLAASEKSLSLLNRGDAASWFLMALAEWQKGEKEKALGSFNQAAARMREQDAKSPMARQLWAEASGILGQPDPDGPGGLSRSRAPEKPR